MTIGDLLHLDLCFFQINLPGTVCCIIRSELVQLLKTPLVFTLLKPDRKVLGPLPETFQLSVLMIS